MNKKGFTLIEMLVVIAIISLVGISFSGGYSYLAKREMQNVAQTLKEVIEGMQQQAAMENRTYKLYMDGKQTLYVAADAKKILTYTVPKKIDVYIGTEANYFVPGKEIAFTKDLSPSGTGTITIWHTSIPYHMKMTVRPVTGIVTIYDLEKN